MNISPIIQYNQKTSFGARLFDKNGIQIKSFCDWSLTPAINEMAERGSYATDIFIKNVISEEKYDAYQNSIDYEIENPLFGRQRFIQKDIHETNAPITCELGDEVHCLDLLTGNTEYLENKAVKKSLLDGVGRSIKNRNCKTPTEILSNALKETPADKHGFSDERIKDFYSIAQSLTSELIINGYNSITNR